MSSWDDPEDVLRVPELPGEIVDGLLDGTVAPDEAPLGYEDVAALFHAATGPASSGELLGTDAAVTALVSGGSTAPTEVAAVTGSMVAASGLAESDVAEPVDELSRRRRRAVSRPAKAVIAGIVVATAIGGVAAAATGNLPIPVVGSEPSTTTVPATTSVEPDRGDGDRNTPGERTSAPTTGPQVQVPPAVDPGALPGAAAPGTASSSGGSDDSTAGRSGDANPGGQSTTGATASADKGANGNGSTNGNGATNGNGVGAGGVTPTVPPAAGGNGQGATNGQGVGASNGVGTANAPTDPAERSRRP